MSNLFTPVGQHRLELAVVLKTLKVVIERNLKTRVFDCDYPTRVSYFTQILGAIKITLQLLNKTCGRVERCDTTTKRERLLENEMSIDLVGRPATPAE